MERLARLVMHHRRIVSAIWVALFVGGLFSVSALSDRWTLDFSLPGQPGDQAEQQLIDKFDSSTFDTYVAVVTVPEGETVLQNQDAVAGVIATAVAAVPDVHAASGGLREYGRSGLRHRRRALDLRADPGTAAG